MSAIRTIVIAAAWLLLTVLFASVFDRIAVGVGPWESSGGVVGYAVIAAALLASFLLLFGAFVHRERTAATSA